MCLGTQNCVETRIKCINNNKNLLYMKNNLQVFILLLHLYLIHRVGVILRSISHVTMPILLLSYRRSTKETFVL